MRGSFMISLLSMALAACASRPAERVDTLDPDAFAAVFKEQHQCWGAWGALLRDWKARGGGFKSSMRETRRQIAEDQESDFARLVRRAWDRQAMAQAGRWQWPVEADRIRAVKWNATGEGYVPANCEGSFWLDDLLWDELRFEGGDPAQARRFLETPVGMAWESPDAQHWTSYWLFAKIGLIQPGLP
jgi:hypothetical protein